MRKLLLVLLFAGLALSAQAQGTTKDSELKGLGLTENQQKKMHDIRESQRAKMETVGKEIRDKRRQLKNMLDNPTTSRPAAQALADQIKILQAKMIDQRLDAVFAAKSILTPEQYAKFAVIMEKHRPQRFERANAEK